jgi:septal ring factor EnvC (AmiA/AmiB activator)
MKNEERIIELLAEYLQKTDRILDRLDSHDHLFAETLKRMDITSQQTQELQNQTKELQKETKELRSESLKHEIKNDVLLKEILSISKRVMTLEERNNLFG